MSAEPGEKPIALVTGTSRGLGRGIAKYLLESGYRVFGCSRGDVTIESPFYHHTRVELLEEQQIRDWIISIRQRFGRLDVAVCNAGTLHLAPALATTSEQFNRVVQTNLVSTALVCQEAARLMIPRRFGRIINLSSIAVAMNDVGTSAYTASKCAIEGYTKVLAKELSTFDITCNVIQISIIESDMTRKLSTDAVSRVVARLTVRRFASMEDVYNLLSFLISERSSYVSGEVIRLGYGE